MATDDDYFFLKQKFTELFDFVYSVGTPAQFDRILYWLGKPQGPYWHDLYQEQLIDTLLQHPNMELLPEMKDANPEEHSFYRCKKSGQLWLYSCHEWRNAAYIKTLTPIAPMVALPKIGAPHDGGDMHGAEFYTDQGCPYGYQIAPSALYDYLRLSPK